ncbi:BppU family phage baseplate upper protein [Limosilactobacillus fermentum]
MSQTLTYVIGGDRRANVDNIQDFKVDFGNDNQNWVQARQFERGMRQVFVNVVNEDNTPFDLTGCNVWFEGLLPKTANGDFRVIDSDGYVPLDPSSGKFRFDMPGQAFTVAGSYRQAFFRIVKNGNSVTTLEFDLDVLADKVIDGLIPKDWIGPFETIADQLVDDLQKHTDAADKIVADFQQKVTNLVNQLNQQGSTTTSMLVELQNRITALETQIKQDGLITQGQMDKLVGALSDFKMRGTTVADKINGEFEGRGVNVKWFGAVGDGTTNDTEAIKKAIAYCTDMAGEVDGEHSYYHGTVFFPKGKYYIGEKLTVSNVTLTGADKYSSIIVSNSKEAVFSLKMHSTITNLGFEDTVTSNTNGSCNRMLTIENGGEGTTAYFGIRLKHLFFRGQEKVTGSDGVLEGGNWVSDAIYLDLNNIGVWDLDIDDISCNYMHSGITIDTQNGGWLTGSHFNNILVRGFTGWHTAIISSNNTARQVSQNVFSNLTAEVLYKSAVNSIGFIVSGVGNDWENLVLFADGTFSGHAIQLKYYGSSDPKMPSLATGSSANNAFWGGTLEGDIDDPDGIRELQSFHNLRLQLKDKYGNGQQVNVNNQTHINLMASDTIAKMLDYRSMISLAKTASAITGSDKYGKYLEITTGSDVTTWDLLFTEPEKVQETITAGDYSLGVKFQKMTQSSEIIGGFIALGGQPSLSNDLVGRYTNPSIDGDLSVTSWVYRYDAKYIASLPSYSYPMDRLVFTIAANSKVRLYDAYLSGGRVIDFSRVAQNNTTNAQVDSGGRNYIQSGNSYWLQSDSPVTNQAVNSHGFTIDTNDIQWMRGKNVVISVDMSITGYDATNVTGRYAASLILDIAFADGSTISTATGPVNSSQSLIFDRYSLYLKLPNKKITSARATLSTPSGFTATYYRIGNAMLESGTVAHDYISYTGSRDN